MYGSRKFITFNVEKIIQVLAYIQRKIDTVEKSKIMKLLFFSDRINIRDTLSLISFDTYYAFRNGPVAYRSLAVLNKYEELIDPKNTKFLEKIDIFDRYSVQISEHNTDYISKVEMASIDKAYDIFGSFSNDELLNIICDYPEWKRFKYIFENWQSEGELIVMDDFFRNASIDNSPSIFKYFTNVDPLYIGDEQLQHAMDTYHSNERYRNSILAMIE